MLPCLRPLECNEKNQIRFIMKGEKIIFKENIPSFYVQGIQITPNLYFHTTEHVT
jgi:hypothetical protein